MTRACRRLVARCLIAALLFLQLAVAAYACPGLAAQAGRPVSAAMADDRPVHAGCPMADKRQPNLCREHCERNSQALDQSPPAALALPVLPLLAVVATEPANHRAESVDSRELLARATAPPAAIRFCVFRI